MNKEQIISLIEGKHHLLTRWLDEHGRQYWEYGPEDKWTTGQHIIHLVQSLKPLIIAMSVPKLILRMRFGLRNRPLRTYDEIKDRYLQRLKENPEVVSPYSSKIPECNLSEMKPWVEKLTREKDKLVSSILKYWTEEQLDKHVLPHPLLGKMPVRELLMWTAYHTEHHTHIIIERATDRAPS